MSYRIGIIQENYILQPCFKMSLVTYCIFSAIRSTDELFLLAVGQFDGFPDQIYI